MTDQNSYLEKTLARSKLELDARTKPGTADTLLRNKLSEQTERFAKIGSPKAKQILSRLATGGLPTDQALATVQQALGEVLASAVTIGTTKQQPAPVTPVRVLAPPPPAPKKSPTQLQEEADVALLDCYAAIGDPQERMVWYRANQGAYDRAHARVTRAATEAKEAKRLATFRTEHAKVTKAQEQALAGEYKALTNVMARRNFDARHPGIADKCESGEL